jgi:tRNA 2-thiouridine synthesizing protein A
MSVGPNLRLDERGRPCPAPVAALARAAKRLDPGDVVELLADDPGVDYDVPAWCRMRGADILSKTETDGARTFVIRLGTGTPAA